MGPKSKQNDSIALAGRLAGWLARAPATDQDCGRRITDGNHRHLITRGHSNCWRVGLWGHAVYTVLRYMQVRQPTGRAGSREDNGAALSERHMRVRLCEPESVCHIVVSDGCSVRRKVGLFELHRTCRARKNKTGCGDPRRPASGRKY